jgi:hypothetical protein
MFCRFFEYPSGSWLLKKASTSWSYEMSEMIVSHRNENENCGLLGCAFV